MSDELPRALEKQLNAVGIYFREPARDRFIIEDQRPSQPRFLGRTPLWRADPYSIRNYFHSKQEAYAALTGDDVDFDLGVLG